MGFCPLMSCNVSSFMKSARRGIRFPAPSGVPQGGIAQGASPGKDGPLAVPRLRETPLPRGRERGRG